MRKVRLLAVVLTLLTAGLLLGTPAGAQPPSKLTEHITDSSGVLTGSDRVSINSAIDRLYRDRHIQLWVVYVDNFARLKPENWADQTRTASGMGGHDALLAIATNSTAKTKYAFSAPSQLPGFTTDELDSLRNNKIAPAVDAKDWVGAAVAAADGLNKANGSSQPASSPKRNWLPVALGVAVALVALVVLVVIFFSYRRLRRRSTGTGDAREAIDGRELSLGQALSIAEARLRQITDYVGRHRDSIGNQAQARFDDAKRYLAAAHDRQASNAGEAVAYANWASTLAAEAQSRANDDVKAAHGNRSRRGRSSKG